MRRSPFCGGPGPSITSDHLDFVQQIANSNANHTLRLRFRYDMWNGACRDHGGNRDAATVVRC